MIEPSLNSLLYGIIELSNFAPLPLVLLLGLRWKKLSSAQRFFGWILLAITLNQLLAKAITEFTHWSNMPLYSIYILLEGPGLLLLYRFRIGNLRHPLFVFVIGALGCFTVVNFLFIQGMWMVPSYSRSLEAILVLSLALYYFRVVFQEQKVKRLDQSFWFWISSGVLIYFTSNLLLFMFNNSLTGRKDELFVAVWSIHAVLNFVLYGFYSIAYLCRDQESSSSF